MNKGILVQAQSPVPMPYGLLGAPTPIPMPHQAYARGPIITDGLVLHLDAGNPASYPGAGTTWFDLSGNGKNGTLVNGPTYSSSNGGSFVFDGSNDYAEIAAPSPFSGTKPFTFEIWFNLTSVTGNFGPSYKAAFLLAGGSGSGYNQTELIIISANSSSFAPSWLAYGGGGGTGIGTFSLSSVGSLSSLMFNGFWYQLIMTKPTSNSQLVYLNSTLIGTGTISNSFADGSVDFGGLAGNSSYSGYLNGRIGSIRAYNRALSAQEVQQNFNVTRSRFGI